MGLAILGFCAVLAAVCRTRNKKSVIKDKHVTQPHEYWTWVTNVCAFKAQSSNIFFQQKACSVFSGQLQKKCSFCCLTRWSPDLVTGHATFALGAAGFLAACFAFLASLAALKEQWETISQSEHRGTSSNILQITTVFTLFSLVKIQAINWPLSFK